MSTCFSLTHEQLAQSGYEYSTKTVEWTYPESYDECGFVATFRRVEGRDFVVHAKDGSDTLVLHEMADFDNPNHTILFCNAFRSLPEWAQQFARDAGACITDE